MGIRIPYSSEPHTAYRRSALAELRSFGRAMGMTVPNAKQALAGEAAMPGIDPEPPFNQP